VTNWKNLTTRLDKDISTRYSLYNDTQPKGNTVPDSRNKEGALRLISGSTTSTDTQAIVLALLYIGDQIELNGLRGE
jgi:hypothetical protein